MGGVAPDGHRGRPNGGTRHAEAALPRGGVGRAARGGLRSWPGDGAQPRLPWVLRSCPFAERGPDASGVASLARRGRRPRPQRRVSGALTRTLGPWAAGPKPAGARGCTGAVPSWRPGGCSSQHPSPGPGAAVMARPCPSAKPRATGPLPCASNGPTTPTAPVPRSARVGARGADRERGQWPVWPLGGAVGRGDRPRPRLRSGGDRLRPGQSERARPSGPRPETPRRPLPARLPRGAGDQGAMEPGCGRDRGGAGALAGPRGASRHRVDPGHGLCRGAQSTFLPPGFASATAGGTGPARRAGRYGPAPPHPAPRGRVSWAKGAPGALPRRLAPRGGSGRTSPAAQLPGAGSGRPTGGPFAPGPTGPVAQLTQGTSGGAIGRPFPASPDPAEGGRLSQGHARAGSGQRVAPSAPADRGPRCPTDRLPRPPVARRRRRPATPWAAGRRAPSPPAASRWLPSGAIGRPTPPVRGVGLVRPRVPAQGAERGGPLEPPGRDRLGRQGQG